MYGRKPEVGHTAEKDVSATIERGIKHLNAVVPFAGGEAVVTQPLQLLAQGLRRREGAILAHEISVAEKIAVPAEIRLAGVQHKATRRTDRSVVGAEMGGARERHPASRQPVQVWRLYRFQSKRSQRGPALVIYVSIY